MTTLDIYTKGQKILLSQGIFFIRNIIYTKHKTFQSLMDKPHSKFHHANINKRPTNTEADILYNLTGEEWDSFCTGYI